MIKGVKYIEIKGGSHGLPGDTCRGNQRRTRGVPRPSLSEQGLYTRVRIED
jgi:hypothetical protein